MNKKLFLIPALATLLFSSCSSDDAPDSAPADIQDGEKYLAVSITTGGGLGVGGRADDTGGTPAFEDGVGDECKINADALYFFFFDKDGYPFPLAAANVAGTVTTNMVQPADVKIQHGTGSEKDNNIEAVLVLGKAVGDGYVGTQPAQVLVIANPSIAFKIDEYKNLSLATVLSKTSSAPTSIPATTGFVITSSTYADGTGKIITAQDVTGHFADTPEKAKEDPVVLYMERLAAKVRVKGLKEYTPQIRKPDNTLDTTGKIEINNVETEIKVELTGWELIKTAEQSTAFKKLLPEWTATATQPFDGWNDALRHRSYWAHSEAGTIQNTSIPELTPSATETATYTKGNFDETKPTENIAYCYENTAQPAKVNDRSIETKSTAIVVKGIVKTTDGTPVDLMRWAGSYYTSDQLKQKIVDDYNGQRTGSTEATIDDVKFVNNTASDNTWHATVTVGNDTKEMANFQNILWWDGGATSYYVNIEHFGGKYGVVRNHIYEYVFDGVIGLGVPGEETDTPEETESFLAAKLYCLNWHLLSHTITLE